MCIFWCVEAAPCVGTMQQDSLRRQKYKKLMDCTVLSCENRAARHFLVLLLLLHFSRVGVEDKPLAPLISK